MIGKNGKQSMNPWVVIALVALAIYIFNPGAFSFLQSSGGTVSNGGGGDSGTIVVESCEVASPTVKFSAVDLYSKGTAVTQGHRVLQLGSKINIEKADGGTESASVGDAYRVLMGNITEASLFTAGTEFYPQYKTGTIGCDGAPGVQGELAKTQSTANTVYTYWNNNDAANTAQSLGASDQKTVRIRFAATDNACFGNPYAGEMGGKNVMCFTYNSTTYSSVELVGGASASRPKSATAVAGKDTVCYEWDIICDNADWEGKVVLKTSSTQPTGESHNVSISLHDITFDYDADTLDLIVDVEDESKTRNDLGVTDINTGDAWHYGIAVT